MRDTVFQQALDALDNGDAATLRQILMDHPGLAAWRASEPNEGYFAHPYLLWYIADNPIRRGTLAPNIKEMADLLLQHIKGSAPDTFTAQRDYALGLVVTGRIPKECGVQIPLIDLLIDNGAIPGNGIGALTHGNPETARYLIAKTGNWTLPAAAGLNEMAHTQRLFTGATKPERELALVIAAFYGQTAIVAWLLAQGVSPNGYPEAGSGFHTHATALHQAVWSGSLETVKLLLNAGADPAATDKIYQGTPLGWAEHGQNETTDPARREHLRTMAETLRHAR
jgi:peptide-methionine (S)-S-oxide reductase